MWYPSLNKSVLTPPDIVFKIVWPILYVLMFASLFLFYISYDGNDFLVSTGFIFFSIQLILNVMWPLVFFRYHKILLSLILILLITVFVGLTINQFLKASCTAAFLLLPYLVWLLFASYLNIIIYLSNP